MGRMNKVWSRVVGMVIFVGDVGGVMSPIYVMVVIRAPWSLWVVCIGMVFLISDGEDSVEIGIRKSQWSMGELVGV